MEYSPLKLALYHFSNYRELSFKQQINYPFDEIKDEGRFLRDIPLDKVNTGKKVEYKWKFTKVSSKLHPKYLAEAGFFYSPNPKDEHKDVVTCYMCQCQIDDWATGDNPIKYHCEVAPKCHLVVSKLKFLNEKLPLEKIPFTDEKYFTSRLKTFREWWPHQFKKSKCNPYELAQAGFCLNASTEYQDQTECTHCKLVVKGWNRNQVPFQVHSELSPSCPIVKLILKQSSQKPKNKELYLPTISRNPTKISKTGVKQEERTIVDIAPLQKSNITNSIPKKRGRKPNALKKLNKDDVTTIEPALEDKPYSLRSSKKLKLKQEEVSAFQLAQTQANIEIPKSKYVGQQTLKVFNRKKSNDIPIIKDEQRTVILQQSLSNILSGTHSDNQKQSNLTATANIQRIDRISDKSRDTKAQVTPTISSPNQFSSDNQNMQNVQHILTSNTNKLINYNIKSGLPASAKISSLPSSSGHKSSSSKEAPAVSSKYNSKSQNSKYLKPQSRSTTTSHDNHTKSAPSELLEFWKQLPPQANITTVIPTGTRLKLNTEDRDILYFLAQLTKEFTLPQLRPSKTLKEFDGTPKQYLELTKQKAREMVRKRTQYDTIRKEKAIELLKNWENDDKLKAELQSMRAHVDRKKRLKEEQRKRDQGK